MSELKNLVPPPKLCKLIPAGEFADTYAAYFWDANGENIILDKRDGDAIWKDIVMAPAPTLQEIMENMTTLCVTPEIFHAHKNYWTAQGETLGDDGMFKFNHGFSSNPATAALKLWFELKGIEA